MALPNTLDGQIVWLVREVAELKRRARNRKRTGKVDEIDHAKGLARVDFGEGFRSGWIPWKEVAAGGIKSHIPPTVGEQVDVVSENGDLTDAVIDMSSPSNENPRPHDGPEAVITHGSSRVFISDGEIRLTAGKIVLDGEVHLGGEGGAQVHRIGDTDSDGDVATTGASRVFAL